MTQKANRRIEVAASPQICFEVATQVELYPDWIAEIKEAQVVSRDQDGLPGQVFYRLAAMGRSLNYTLDYYYGTNPLRVAWRMSEGTLLHQLNGEYRFEPMAGKGSACELNFRLEVDLLTKIPGFVTRRAEQLIIKSATEGLRDRAELLAAT